MSIESRDKIALLSIIVDGQKLGDRIKDWSTNPATQELISKAINDNIITWEQANRAHQITTDPFEAVTKKSFEIIPEGVACQDCSMLDEVASYTDGVLVVKCVGPFRRAVVSMKVDFNEKGGAIAIEGTCLNNSDGIQN
jgi:hypothetical protein